MVIDWSDYFSGGSSEKGEGAIPVSGGIFVLVDPGPTPAIQLGPSRKVIGKARALADQLGSSVTVLLPAPHDACSAGCFRVGADRICVIASFQKLAELIGRENPEILLLEFSPRGIEYGPQLAQRFKTGLTYCFDVDLDPSSRCLVQKIKVYDGKMVVEVVTPEARPQIAVLDPAGLLEAPEDPRRTGEIVRI